MWGRRKRRLHSTVVTLVFLASALPASSVMVVNWIAASGGGSGLLGWLRSLGPPLLVVWIASSAFAYVVGRYVTDEFRRLQVLSALVVNSRDVEQAASVLHHQAQFDETRAFVQTLSRLLQRERTSEARVKRLAAFVAHDMRTPVAAARMAIRANHEGPKQWSDTSRLVGIELDRVLHDLDLLVDALRGRDVGDVKNDGPKSAMVSEVVGAVRAMLLDTFSAQLIVKVHKDFRTSVPERSLQRILENLAINAVKHGRGSPWIEIGVGLVRVGNAVGGDTVDVARLPRTADSRSYGLGLRVVADILERYDGRLVIESSGEDVFVVLVYLPVLPTREVRT